MPLHNNGNDSVFIANGSYLDRKYGKMANGAIIMANGYLNRPLAGFAKNRKRRSIPQPVQQHIELHFP